MSEKQKLSKVFSVNWRPPRVETIPKWAVAFSTGIWRGKQSDTIQSTGCTRCIAYLPESKVFGGGV